MRVIGLAVAMGVVLAGCAKSSSQVGTTYVSPLVYQSLTCQQIVTETTRVSGQMTQLGARLDSAAQTDSALTAVGFVLFWPAFLFLGGTQAQEAEYGRLKGEYDALMQASVRANCGLPGTGIMTASDVPAATALSAQSRGQPAEAGSEEIVTVPTKTVITASGERIHVVDRDAIEAAKLAQAEAKRSPPVPLSSGEMVVSSVPEKEPDPVRPPVWQHQGEVTAIPYPSLLTDRVVRIRDRAVYAMTGDAYLVSRSGKFVRGRYSGVDFGTSAWGAESPSLEAVTATTVHTDGKAVLSVLSVAAPLNRDSSLYGWDEEPCRAQHAIHREMLRTNRDQPECLSVREVSTQMQDMPADIASAIAWANRYWPDHGGRYYEFRYEDYGTGGFLTTVIVTPHSRFSGAQQAIQWGKSLPRMFRPANRQNGVAYFAP